MVNYNCSELCNQISQRFTKKFGYFRRYFYLIHTLLVETERDNLELGRRADALRKAELKSDLEKWNKILENVVFLENRELQLAYRGWGGRK